MRRVKLLKVVLPPAQVEHLNIHSHERRHVLDDLEIDEELEALPIPETVAGSAWKSRDEDICELSRQEWGASANISVKSALAGPDCDKSREAIVQELNNMIVYDVWEPVKASKPGSKVLYSKMFLKKKFTSDGKFDKIKARLVVGGNIQDEGSYDETASPTVDQGAIMMGLGIAARVKGRVWSTDVPAAYLNALVLEEIFVCLGKEISRILMDLFPEYGRFLRSDGTILVKLKKALYGLKQSALAWYKTLKLFLEGAGFKTCDQDRCVFHRRNGKKFCLVFVHVDDLLIVENWEEGASDLRDKLRVRFGVNKFDKNSLSYLGMNIQVDSTAGRVSVDQSAYIKDYLKGSRVICWLSQQSRRRTRTSSRWIRKRRRCIQMSLGAA